MKRFFCVLFAVILCISLAACGSPTPKEINEKTVKIVVVCEGDEQEETSQAAVYAAELEAVASAMGIEEEQLTVCDGISAADSAFAEAAIRSYIKEGYSIVFGTLPGYAVATKKLAAEFPRVTFIQVGDADASLPNFYAYRLKMYEGAFLCGLAAGKTAAGDMFGMVASSIDSIETHQMANAFLLGARVGKPQATLKVAQGDVTTYATAISALQQQGCEGLLMTIDSEDAIDFAESADLRIYTVFGRPDTDIVDFSVTVHHRNQLGDTVQAVLSHVTPYYNNIQVGYADGFLQCVQGFDEEGNDVTALVRALQAVLSKGTWDVFSGVKLAWDATVQAFAPTPAAIKDTDGTVRIAAGAGLPTAETLNGMDWWMEGVSVQ